MSTNSAAQLSLEAPEDSVHHESVAIFVTKLWGILSKPDYSHLISWSENGDTFIVKDSAKFSREVLPYYFKHNKFNSFVRQLNLYGFRKMIRPDGGSLSKSSADDSMEFWHTQFTRNSPKNLHLVQRRKQQQGSKLKMQVPSKGSDSDGEKNPHRLSAVMSDIHQMKGRQEGIATILDTLKQDNSHIRHELMMLKDKHVRQQKILNKIIHFLVHMVYKRNIPSARRTARQSSMGGNQLMLMESLLPPSKKIRLDSDPVDPIEEISLSDDFPSAMGFPGNMPPLSPTLPSSPTSLLSSAVAIPTPAVSSSSIITSLPQASPTPLEYIVSSPESIPTPVTPVLSTPSDIAATTTTEVGMGGGGGGGVDVGDFKSTQYQYPLISEELLKTCPIPPAPSSLVHVPHPENRMCIHGQLQHQQLGLDNLPEFLSGQLSLDPNLVSDFVLSDQISQQLPDYDYGDTARLLESLMSSDEPIQLNPGTSVIPLLDTEVDSSSPTPRNQ